MWFILIPTANKHSCPLLNVRDARALEPSQYLIHRGWLRKIALSTVLIKGPEVTLCPDSDDDA